MYHHDIKQKKKQRKKASKTRFFCVALIASSVVICGAAYGNMALSDNRTTVKKPETGSTVVDDKDINETNTNSNVSDEISWNLLLVNPWNKLPDNYSVSLTKLSNGHAIDERAYPDLQAMMDDARGQGLFPIICSSFRTKEKQQILFDNQVSQNIAAGYSKEKAATEASKWVAPPGTSEHQTGLAVDIVSLHYQLLDKNQEATAEQKWLMQNSYRYGFILRYPSDKSEITGIGYEPWHYRYVGKEAAKEMYEKSLCLEEYLSSK